MASSLPFYSIEFDENDVPGAKLIKPTIEEHSVLELKRFLACRNVKTTGKKRELVERVKEHINKKTKISKTVDGGAWYEEKLKNDRNINLENILEKPPSFPVNGWKKFPSNKIPNKYSYGSIFRHFIEVKVLNTSAANNTEKVENDSDSDEDYEYCSTSKPLRKGRQFFLSGHVKNLEDVSFKGHYCIKSNVQSSYRENITFKVMVMINEAEGNIVDSSCHCVASAMGRCSHIAGLLFALEDYTINFGYCPLASTSKLCSWNQGRKEKNPTRIGTRKYSNKTDPNEKIEFNPSTTTQEPQEIVNNLLYQCQSYSKPTMWELLLEYKYEDYVIESDREFQLENCVKQLQQSLIFGLNVPGEVPNTRGQAECDRWHQLHKLLITASKCKEFCIGSPTDMFTKLKNMMWYSNFVGNKFTEYGSTHESIAVKRYSQISGYIVEKTGLWVNPKYIGLGASPDGLVFDKTTNTYGLLEIKCPYVMKDKCLTDLSHLNQQQLYSFCSAFENDGKLHLKKTHKYYYQVQMQMAILEKNWCDFVIWTSKGIEIERIFFDQNFWNSIYPKLLNLHMQIISPEYFEMRIPRKLNPLYLSQFNSQL